MTTTTSSDGWQSRYGSSSLLDKDDPLSLSTTPDVPLYVILVVAAVCSLIIFLLLFLLIYFYCRKRRYQKQQRKLHYTSLNGCYPARIVNGMEENYRQLLCSYPSSTATQAVSVGFPGVCGIPTSYADTFLPLAPEPSHAAINGPFFSGFPRSTSLQSGLIQTTSAGPSTQHAYQSTLSPASSLPLHPNNSTWNNNSRCQSFLSHDSPKHNGNMVAPPVPTHRPVNSIPAISSSLPQTSESSALQTTTVMLHTQPIETVTSTNNTQTLTGTSVSTSECDSITKSPGDSSLPDLSKSSLSSTKEMSHDVITNGFHYPKKTAPQPDKEVIEEENFPSPPPPSLLHVNRGKQFHEESSNPLEYTNPEQQQMISELKKIFYEVVV